MRRRGSVEIRDVLDVDSDSPAPQTDLGNRRQNAPTEHQGDGNSTPAQFQVASGQLVVNACPESPRPSPSLREDR